MDHTQAMHASDIITRQVPRKHCQCLVDENINEKDGNDDDEGLLTHVPFYRKSPLIELKLKIAGSFNSVGPKGYSPPTALARVRGLRVPCIFAGDEQRVGVRVELGIGYRVGMGM